MMDKCEWTEGRLKILHFQKFVSTAIHVSKQINCQYNFPVVCAHTCVYVHVKTSIMQDWDMPKSFI
jgi:hypothetical protein